MQEIHIVGCSLEGIARDRTDGARDAFARSTFNRFYYATFLEVRNFLKNIEYESWDKIPHKSYPEVLLGLEKKLKKEATRSKRASDNETYKMISQAIPALQRVSGIMQSGYSSRIVADYQSETPVIFNEGGPFYLNSISVNVAKSWHEDVRRILPVILQACNLIK